MKTKLTAALLLALPCLAYAQPKSPDTLVFYGALDTGYQYQHLYYKNTQNIPFQPSKSSLKIVSFAPTDGYLVANRVGLFGAHKLADRFYTIFNLEAGLNLADGSLKEKGVLFSRRAFLGLQGVFGRITIGRQPDAVNKLLGPDPFGTPGIGLYYDLFGSTVGTLDSRSILYLTPEYKGVQLGVSTFKKPASASQPGERTYALAAQYKLDKFSISTGYIHNNRTHKSSWVINSTAKLGAVTVYGRYARANEYQSTFLNKVFLLYNPGYQRDNDRFPFETPNIKIWSIGATIPVSKTGDLVLSFQQGHEYSKINGTSKANFYRLAYKEQISKRTFAYCFGGLFDGYYKTTTVLNPKTGAPIPAQYKPSLKIKLTGYGGGFGFVHTF